jgi:F-type H+-transporting ATPase subunit delta
MRRRAAQGSARRYARALLGLALERNEADRLREELRQVVEAIRSHRELQVALEHPAVATTKKRQLVSAVFGRDKTPSLAVRLLDLLAQRDRMDLLPAIEEAYRSQLNEQRGIVAAEAVTATPLDATQRDALRTAIGEATGRPVEMRSIVDPAVGGGVVVRMLGRTYDGTIRGRLRAMKRRLVEGAERA